MDISVSTRWRAAHEIITSSPSFKSDSDLQKIENLDILGVYEDYAIRLEQEHAEESRRLRIETIRKARKAREGFKSLLNGLVEKGDVTRLSQWKDLYPLIRDDERYEALLGLPGSSPLDLWMDTVDDLGEEAERAVEKIERALGKEGLVIGLEVDWEGFEGMIKKVGMELQIDIKLRREAYDIVRLFLEVPLRPWYRNRTDDSDSWQAETSRCG